MLAKVEIGEAHVASMRKASWRVVAPLAALGVSITLWCAHAPLSGAVVANGQVQTQLGRKTVQHLEGGILREVLVRDGQRVRRGDALLVVSDVRSDAAFELLRKQGAAERIRGARARAELAFAPAVAWPEDASSGAVARERELFESRRQTLQAQLGALQMQLREARSRAAALSAQFEASRRSTELAREELAIHARLADSGFIQKTRLMALERDVAERHGRVEAARGQIAEARMQAAALGNSLAQTRDTYQQRATDEFRDSSERLRDIEEHLRASQDQFERQTVRAPVDGTVMKLRVSAPGTAVGPREPLLEIVPADEPLVVELHIDPHDIDHVRQGGAADVRLSAFDARTSQLLCGVVSSVSPDATTDPASQRTWYVAQVEVSHSELAKHRRLRLQAGMPAEVFITTPPRSVAEYLLEPLGMFVRRAMREP
jgi:HlyD family type I secretion membrane fusion protein